MPRPPRNRKVCTPPKMTGFKPYGLHKCSAQPIILSYDEFEGLKYINYDNVQQGEAAAKMEISRPTFSRLYQSALKKIATAFVEGKTIEIEGGNIQFTNEWLRCRNCYKLINGRKKHEQCAECRFYDDEEQIDTNKI